MRGWGLRSVWVVMDSRDLCSWFYFTRGGKFGGTGAEWGGCRNGKFAIAAGEVAVFVAIRKKYCVCFVKVRSISIFRCSD
jgi:hypothetical protein